MTVVINGTTGITSVNGSAAAPSVTGTDTDTGIVYGTNTLSLATNGTTMVSVNTVATTFGGSYVSFNGNGYIRTDITNSLALQSGSSTSIGWQVKNSGNSVAMLAMSGVAGSSLALENASPVAGTGITFPATQSASTNANTLDDYEEGTWTPTVTFGGASVGITYTGSYRIGNYVKVGRMVTITGIVYLANKGSSTGTAKITGLPFASSNTTAGFTGPPVGYMEGITFTGQLGFDLQPNESSLICTNFAESGSYAYLTNTNFSNASQYRFCFSYITD